ncbi:MAG: energy transducer TonB [Pyrinomonadaceae bacterium]
MFDKLVESSSTGAELGPRRRIFAATLVLVTTLFATAVVASIYAADFDLGTSSFEIAELLTPVTETEPPREPEPQQRRDNQQNTTNETTRQVLMASTSDFTRVPPTTSTAANPYLSIPEGKFKIGIRDTTGPPPDAPAGNNIVGSSSSGLPEFESADPKTAPPAPPKVEVPKRTVSIGVANGIAIDLPKPPYPPAAIAVQAKGAVSVQVTIDEQGKVISARAASGHILLRKVAEQAAWKARFTPTKLSNVPVKVTGVIVYNFTRD